MLLQMYKMMIEYVKKALVKWSKKYSLGKLYRTPHRCGQWVSVRCRDIIGSRGSGSYQRYYMLTQIILFHTSLKLKFLN
jgi:hypothetical protein